MKKYSISKASHFLNISSELLRYYERLGLIEPERSEKGYRFFDYRDIDKLQGIRRYRNMGFSMTEMDRLIDRAEYDEVASLYRSSLRKTRKEVAWLTELAAATAQMVDEWEALESNIGRIEITTSPEILRVELRRNETFDEEIVIPEVAKWMEYLPVVFISPAFPVHSILQQTHDVTFGYGVERATFERIGLAHVSGEQHIPSQQCLSTVVFSYGEGSISARELEPLKRFCEEYHLRITGDAWGKTIGNCMKDGVTHRYHRVYLPVR